MAEADDSLVLVTGASGYIATHAIQQLQRAGHKVRGTVRSTKDEKKTKPIKELCPEAQFPVELVEADLSKEEGWEDAVRGCSYVLHIASPFPAEVPRDENEVIKPAIDGTMHVLKACAKVGGVKRVVLTSSIAAVSGGFDVGGDQVYSEEDWTDHEKPGMAPYTKSKTLAEKAAWDYLKELPEEQRFELAVINPGAVMGPVLCGTFTTSMQIPKRVLEKEMPMLPNLNFAVIDVRDVAKAHIIAMKLPEANGKRHILVNENISVKDMALIWEKEFKPQGYNIPTKTAPNVMLKVLSIFDKPIKQIIPMLGKVTKLENSRMKNVLGIEPISIENCINDMVYTMIDNGMIKKTAKYKGKE